LLPEVQKKQEEERKKKEYKERMSQVKQFEKKRLEMAKQAEAN